MKAKKVLACLMAGAMVLSLAACGGTETTETPATSVEETTTAEPVAEEKTEPVAEVEVKEDTPKSITFDEGSVSFLGKDTVCNPSADDSVIELGDFGGDSAAVITPQGNKPFVAIQMDAMLGDAISSVASVDLTLAIAAPDGQFHSVSGKVYMVKGEDKSFQGSDWSIYMEKQIPKTITYTLPGAAVAGDYLVLSMESDVAKDEGVGQTTLSILDITFKDASGNVLAADSAAEFVSAATGADRSNLFGITGEVTMELTGSGDGWSQIGYVDFTDEEWAALTTPGSVVEIEYTADTGYIWMGLSGNAWTRIGVGDQDGSGQQYAYRNNSNTIAQITYEQIAAQVGDDTSAWDHQIFIESDGHFEVFSIKIGQQAPRLAVTGAIDISDIGVVGTNGGWAQNGYVDIPDDAFELLKTPGSVLAIEYTSESGDLWAGLSGNAWTRVGVGNADGSGSVDAITDGSVCYVTYDMFAAACGEDSSAWDKQIFIESDTNFEVYSVKVGKAVEFKPTNYNVTFNNSATGGAWSQADILDLTNEEVLAALVPGSVINVSYTSETGECWIVMNGAEAGWMRVGVGDFDGSGQGYAAYDGSTVQIPYEMIAEYCGDDISTWGPTIQAEATSNWEVYSVSIGSVK